MSDLPSRREPSLPFGAESPSVLLGISTFNRKEIVALSARSLGHAENLSRVDLLVIDDVSTEYDLDYLQSIYPARTQLIRQATPCGTASAVAHLLMQSFLRSEHSTLIILDSDLLVAKDFLNLALEMLPRTQGLLSLLHAHTHPGRPAGDLLIKDSVGFAGTVWTRELIREVMEKVPVSSYFDDDICAYLRKENREIYSLRESAVQHIGLSAGENSTFTSADYGLSFKDTSWYNLSAIHETLLHGCQQEFLRLDHRHRQEIARLNRSLESMREELKLVTRGVALYQGDAELPSSAQLTISTRIRCFLAQAAFRLLRRLQRHEARSPLAAPSSRP